MPNNADSAGNILNEMLSARHAALRQRGYTVSFGGTDEPAPPQEDVDIKQVMKERHLSKRERDALHRPNPDFIVVRGKEVCRATHVLEVDDLLE